MSDIKIEKVDPSEVPARCGGGKRTPERRALDGMAVGDCLRFTPVTSALKQMPSRVGQVSGKRFRTRIFEGALYVERLS